MLLETHLVVVSKFIKPLVIPCTVYDYSKKFILIGGGAKTLTRLKLSELNRKQEDDLNFFNCLFLDMMIDALAIRSSFRTFIIRKKLKF